jgi:ankyrin repeat protein
MMKEISIYNKILKCIKEKKSIKAIEIIKSNPGICEKVRNSTGNNLLHIACLYNMENVAKVLFNSKLANEINNDDYYPLYYCTMNNNDTLCDFFIENGVKPDNESYFNAARMCSLYLIKILFKRKIMFNMIDVRNQNLLMHSIKQKRSYNIIDYISNRSDLNQVDIFGNTPMHYACKTLRAGYEKILILLSKKGGDVVIRDRNDKSPLDYIKGFALKLQVADNCKKYGRYYRRRWFLMFLSQYKFLSGKHNSSSLYVSIFGIPDIYTKIMKFL